MVTEYFFNFSYLFVWKNGKKNFPQGKIFFHEEQFFFPNWKIVFPSAILQRNNKIPNQSNFEGVEKRDIK